MAPQPQVAAAVAGSANARRKPPALAIPIASGSGSAAPNNNQGSASPNSDDADIDSPFLSAIDSSAALILVHDPEPESPFEFSDDEGDGEDRDDIVSPLFQVRQSAAVPPLPPSLVLLYLLAPYLKFGALNLPYTQLPLKWGLPALLLSALASAFARQVWYMLARYLRKADLTDILLDTFARGRGKERQRAVIRALVRALLGVVSTLLAVTYLRYSMYTLLPLFAGEHHSVLAYVLSTLLVGLVVSWLSYGRSLNSRRVVYATWLSVATYVAWLGCTIYAHTHGILPDHEGWLGPELSWKGGLATTALAFCSSSTLPLYAALKSRTAHPITTAKTPRTHSFRLLSFVSIIVAVALLLPSVIFAAFPNAPAASSLSLSFQDPLLPSAHTSIPLTAAAASSSFMPTPKPKVLLVNTTTHVPLLPGTLHPPLPSDLIPSIQIHTVRRALASTTLLLGIPSLVVTTPPVAIPSLRSVKFNVSRVLILAFILILSLIPPGAFPSSTDSNGPDNGDLETSRGYLRDSGTIFTLLTTLLVLLAFAGTYFVPAVVHLASHVFKRPLAIVVPAARTPLVNTPLTSSTPNFLDSAAFPDSAASVDSQAPRLDGSPRLQPDELLLRKERALQKRQLKKRIVWDVGVCLLFGASVLGLGVGGSALVWGWW